jgi:site-specific recombinase XerD
MTGLTELTTNALQLNPGSGKTTAYTACLLHEVAHAAVLGMPSLQTQRVYAYHITEYLRFSNGQITRAIVQAWITGLRGQGKGAASLNQSLSAVKKLVEELAERGVIDRTTAQGVDSLKGQKQRGVRVGNWLTIEQATRLMNYPGPGDLRDRALLALMVGCGIRRSEAAGLTWSALQRRSDRWVLADIKGKGGRVRTVAVPDFVFQRLDGYMEIGQCKAPEKSIFNLSASGIWWVVKAWAGRAGLGSISPHDLRRTYAALSEEGGAPIRQIQSEMGHSSLSTTERYLGTIRGLRPGFAAGDHIKIASE